MKKITSVVLAASFSFSSVVSSAGYEWKVFADFMQIDKAEVYCGRSEGARDVVKTFKARKRIALSEIVGKGVWWCGVKYYMSAQGVPFRDNPHYLPAIKIVADGVALPNPPTMITGG